MVAENPGFLWSTTSVVAAENGGGRKKMLSWPAARETALANPSPTTKNTRPLFLRFSYDILSQVVGTCCNFTLYYFLATGNELNEGAGCYSLQYRGSSLDDIANSS